MTPQMDVFQQPQSLQQYSDNDVKGYMHLMTDKKLIADPSVVLREEFDDWAILFDPDTGNAFGLNPVGVLVWKHLDGKSDTDAIVKIIRETADEVPDQVGEDVRTFMKAAVDLGLAGYDIKEG